MKKFKRSFSTVAFSTLNCDEIITLAEETAIKAIEIRLDSQNKICGLDGEELNQALARIKSRGIVITNLGTSICFTGYDNELIKQVNDCAFLAHKAGAKGIRVFLGDFSRKRSLYTPSDYDGIVCALQESAEVAGKYGTEIWIETHNDFSTGEVLAKLLADVGYDNVKIIWDVIHPIEKGENPKDTVKYIGDKIVHIHIKDGIKTNDINETDYQYTKLGFGDVPTGEILRELESLGYDGFLSLEWESLWRKEIKEEYRDNTELLRDFDAYIARHENNIVPLCSENKWQKVTPNVKSVAIMDKGEFESTLDISLSSTSYGIGKWQCDVEIEKGQAYDFSVVARTDSEINNIYVLATVFDSSGSMITREHIRNSSREGRSVKFWDKIEATDEGVKIRIELWLKGYKGVVRWCEPTLVRGESSKSRVVKIALAYIEPNYLVKHTIEGNVSEIIEAIDCSAEHKPDVIVLSECMYERSVSGVSLAETAQGDDGEMCTLIAQKAKWYRSYIVYNFHEVENGEYYNTSVMFDRNGDICGKYRKTHLTVTEFEKGLTPGREYPVFETDFGRVGMLICYDHYFPKTVEKMKDNGAEIIFISTAGDAAERSVARAMDNGIYLAICGLNNENSHGWGAARIIDPDGRILSHTNKSGSPAVCEIDLNRRIRRRWLSVGDAAADIYGVFKYERNDEGLRRE